MKHKNIIRILFSVLLFLVMSEALLRLTDPLGIRRYFSDLEHYYSQLQSDDNLYILQDGTYQFSNWTATIEQGSRRMDSRTSACTIAFMGDSVTFGLGVNDDETWVNLIASQYPEIEIRNYGLPGYNSTDVLERIARIDADGYVYLIIANDAESRLTPYFGIPRQSAIGKNLFFPFVRTQHAPITEQFKSDLAALPINTMLLGFSGEPLAEYAANKHSAILIEQYTSQISIADPHADRTGNIEIYQQIQPHFERFIDTMCL